MAERRPLSARRAGPALAEAGRALLRAGLSLGRRVYALALIVVIVWLSYSAIRYLIVSIASPSLTPPQIVGLPRRLDEAFLHGRRSDWAGLTAVENPRSPLSHYHRFDAFLQPDRFNDCTRGGCHSPLPHSRRKEVRAFLNMHATTLHCTVCHLEPRPPDAALAWYDPSSGAPHGPPALLRAFDWLETHIPSPTHTGADQAQILRLLRAAEQESGGAVALTAAVRQIESTRAGTEAFRESLAAARETVRQSFRGSYGAKIGLTGADGKPLAGHPETEAAVRAWQQRGSQAAAAERENLLRAVHPQRRETPLECLSCHRSGGLMDFAALGYPPSRVQALTEGPIFGMIQHINEGRPFFIPSLSGAPAASPATQPATP